MARLFLTSVFFLFFLSTSSLAQDVKGLITDREGTPIRDCSVILIDSHTNEAIDYTVPNANGSYHFSLKGAAIKKIKIVCQGLLYHADFKVFEVQKGISHYEANFSLKAKDLVLDEVVIFGKKAAIKVKNDTTVYRVSRFKGIEDRKIIDVLDKMPGIQVNRKTGQIRYKGRQVETILLDGDDLFGAEYSLAARNISPEVVETVEAIEDYHKNKLEKGLNRSDKVVINLTFNKEHLDLSGEIAVGIGADSYIGAASGISILKKMKGFARLTLNNISMNETPFQEDTYRNENREEIKNYSPDFLKESSITKNASFPRSYDNRLRFGTYRNLFKLSDKLSFSNSVSAFGDKNKYSYEAFNDINANGLRVKTSDEASNTSTPRYLTLSNEFTLDISKSSILKYSNRFVNNKNLFNQKNVRNRQSAFETQIDHARFYYQQKLNYSNKISAKELIETNVFQSRDALNQELTLLNNKTVQVNGASFDVERIENGRLIVGGDVSYLKKFNQLDLKIKVAHNYNRENFDLDIGGQKFNQNFKNTTSSVKGVSNFFNQKKVNISSTVELGYSDRGLFNEAENESIKKKGIFVNAEAKTRITVKKNNKLLFRIGRNSRLNDPYYLLSNPLLIDTRTIFSNKPSLKFQESWETSINFSHNNVFRQSAAWFSTTYRESRNTILSQQNIREDLSIVSYFQNPLTIKGITLAGSSSFLLDFMSNMVRLKSNVSFNRYYNSLNGSAQKEVWSSNYNFQVELNSSFGGFFNYKSYLGLTYMKSVLEDVAPFASSTLNAGLRTDFKFSKKTYCKVNYELLLPRGREIAKNQLFIDFSLNHYTPKIEYFLYARNLLNKSSFIQVFNTEYSTTIYSKSLFRRYIVLGLGYQI